MAPRKGRSPAKNETAAGLINALKFIGVLKAPTITSMPQAHHVWLNMGMAVGFDGIVAAGHPIDDGIAGYPETKLLLEALENTDKSFTLTVRENGAFEINSGKYSALVPSYDPTQVIQTQPDMNQAAFSDGDGFVKALEAAAKIVSETGDKVLYSAVRLTGDGTVMATDGATIIEAYHGNQTPPGLILPKQFVTSLVKAGKAPVGMGVNHDWSTFTVWFGDNSWLRTATYPQDTWPEIVNTTFHQLIASSDEAADIPNKLWNTAKALMPFTDENNRLIIRPGLVRTHTERRIGAALEVAEIPVSIDISGKRLLAVESMATRFSIGVAPNGVSTFRFFGTNVRGVIAGLEALEEVEPTEQQGGWSSEPQQPAGVAADGGWALSAPATAPPAPAQGWNGIPATGLAGDPEYESERQGIPAEHVTVVEEAYTFTDADNGIPLEGFSPRVPMDENGFVPSQWAENLKDVNE